MTIAPEHIQQPSIDIVKLLLLGESSVGKTSLMNRCTNHSFQQNGTILTIGIEVKKIVKTSIGRRIRLEIWDTAGQQKYKTLPTQYFRGIQGILLIYDITNGESFACLEDWFKKIEQNCEIKKLVITLVGNKVDLQNMREVRKEQAIKFAALKNVILYVMQIHFKETSAKTAMNVDETIQDMLKQIVSLGLEAKKATINLSVCCKKKKEKEESCCN